MKMRLPSLTPNKDLYRHAIVLAVFSCLHVAVMRMFSSSIPPGDVLFSYVAFFAVIGAILLTQHSTNQKPTLTRSTAFTKSFIGLSILETVFTLIAPHALIWWETKNERASPSDYVGMYSVQDLLVPHLFVLQVQILLEMLICMTDAHTYLLFPYTAVANAYRFLAILAWVQHSSQIVASDALKLVQFGWKDYTVLYVLPIMGLFLWVSSSFVFLPFIWYPLIATPRQAKQKSQVH